MSVRLWTLEGGVLPSAQSTWQRHEETKGEEKQHRQVSFFFLIFLNEKIVYFQGWKTKKIKELLIWLKAVLICCYTESNDTVWGLEAPVRRYFTFCHTKLLK